MPRRPQSHAKTGRIHRKLEKSAKCALLQGGLPHAVWSDAMSTVAEHLDRTSDLVAEAPHQMRHGAQSALALAPFGAAVHYRDDELTRGQKLVPKRVLGLAIGYHTAHSVNIFKVHDYVQACRIRVIRSRHHRIAASGCENYLFPYAALMSKAYPSEPWKMAPSEPILSSDELGAPTLCVACGRPKLDGALPLCYACSGSKGRRRHNEESSVGHSCNGQCDLSRRRCSETLELAILGDPSHDLEDVPLQHDIVDYINLFAGGANNDGATPDSPWIRRRLSISRRPRHAGPHSRGLNNSETGGSGVKWKARVVAAGNNLRDGMGMQVCDALDSSAPASLEAIRGMIALGLVGSINTMVQVDVEASYFHAYLAGPPYYLEIPRVAWPGFADDRHTRPAPSANAPPPQGDSRLPTKRSPVARPRRSRRSTLRLEARQRRRGGGVLQGRPLQEHLGLRSAC